MNTKAQDAFMELQYPYPMNEQEVVNDIKIAFADIGKGDPILFIHGMGSYAPAWKKNVSELKKNFRCIVVDLPGYGKSSKGKFEANMSFHKKHLFALMDSLRIKNFHIAGHSMGAQIAIHMALENPDRIKSLILSAPAGIETFNEPQKAMFRAITPEQTASVSDEQYRINLEANFHKMPDDAEFMYNDRMMIKESPDFMNYCYTITQGIRGMVNEPVFERLGELKTPVLILYGKQDKLIPNKFIHPKMSTADIAQIADEKIPQSQTELIENAGHFVHFEQAEKTNKLIMNFIN
ncbi:alpha/beta hydrolase [Mangrovivirga sp. M17]|uniref:Alpha/beta hydrolase n=1 Tax=Mangrovivirga halotolerans TaxID=2993936 RepID=A0ABT3RPC2_9BACT|nr:alpha/beta hydrolase [Mangrovivirga halotolerans]MCX2743020.1 alpha/beta hydrolase [Mangrovivirga halotolerans]